MIDTTERGTPGATEATGAARRPVIVADRISKSYRRRHHQLSLRQEALKLIARPFRGHPAAEAPFWALQDVSFTVNAGESVALIGRNGSGKTTLFRILSGITGPTRGRAAVAGRFATLIALGAGFNYERTGRENIYLNAAIQGVAPRRVSGLLDQILDFAELGEFIDEPVKRYSSGMVARLGFSVAIHTVPDIIFIDEVLAVGDAAFQRKCIERIRAFKAEGRTLLFVSHSPDMVCELCDRAIWLHHGRLLMDGPTGYVLSCYEDAWRVEQHWQAAATPGTGADSPTRPPEARATLVAIPNPVPAYLQNSGTVIVWNTGDGTPGQVYVSRDGGDEVLFSQATSELAAAPWIAPDSTYVFTLYAGTAHTTPLARTVVSRSAT